MALLRKAHLAFLSTFFTEIVSTIYNEINTAYAIKTSIEYTRYTTIIRSKDED